MKKALEFAPAVFESINMKHSGTVANQSTLIESIASYDNLRRAWIKAYHHAKTQDLYFDAFGYQIFEVYLETNLRILANDIKSGRFQPQSIRYATIPKGKSALLEFRGLTFPMKSGGSDNRGVFTCRACRSHRFILSTP